jgi:precorrin-6B methylase 2
MRQGMALAACTVVLSTLAVPAALAQPELSGVSPEVRGLRAETVANDATLLDTEPARSGREQFGSRLRLPGGKFILLSGMEDGGRPPLRVVNMLAQEVGAKADSARTPDVVFVPTPHEVVAKMLELAKVRKDDLVYDLGCGDGRVVIAAAKKYGCRAVGYDIDPQRVKEARENVRKEGLEDLVTIEQADIFELDLSKASVITLYLLPRLNVRLIPQLQKLKPGSRIVSHNFDMEGVRPEQVVEIRSKDGVPRKVFLWTTPLKKKAW